MFSLNNLMITRNRRSTGTGWTEIFRHLEKKTYSRGKTLVQSHFQGRGMIQHVRVKKQKENKNRAGNEDDRKVKEGEAQRADQIMCSMKLEVKCKQRHTTQRGSRFQCMSVCLSLVSCLVNGYRERHKAAIKDMSFKRLPLLRK